MTTQSGTVNILIIDDTPEDVATYRRYLSRLKEHSYKIQEAASGATAFERCRELRPDCILLDYRLPDIDGIDILRRLTEECKGNPIPVVMLTASGDVRTVVEAMKHGAQDYLIKGQTSPEHLALAIDNAIEKVALRNELERQRKWLRTTLASIGDGVIACDTAGEVTFMNEVAENLTGWRQEDALGRSLTEIFDIVNEQTRQPVENPLLRVLGEGRIVGLANHTILIARDGVERPIDDSAAPIRNNYGELIGAILVFRDISERKRAEAEREALLRREQRLREQAEEANRLKDIFLSTVSHELRTPLTPILGWARMLRVKNFDEEARRHAVEIIERNAESQKQLIDDLLDVSRIVTGKLFLERRPVDLHQVIESAIETVMSAAEMKGVEIQADLQPGSDLVMGDTHRLRQVFWNLLSNAVKFTPKGGSVRVRAAREGSQLKVTVKDNGQGIPADFLPYVFDRFRQADGASTRMHGGLGLGLAIVRHLTELHGGAVGVASEGENLGAEFMIMLPLMAVRQDIPPERDTGELRHGTQAEDGIRSSSGADDDLTLSGIRVLVVDDERDARELLEVILAGSGAEVFAASSAAEALDLLQQEQPDIIISDIGMPGEDGLSLISKVRQMPAISLAGLPAIALTAYATSEERHRALKAGFQLHIPKPAEHTELITAIVNLVGAAAIKSRRRD